MKRLRLRRVLESRLLLRIPSIGAACVVAAVAAGAGGSPVADVAAGPPTERVVVMPFHGSLLARGLTVEKTVRGACTGGAERDRRWDAWSCRTRGERRDPCFSGRRTGAGALVACLDAPWSNVVLLELTRPLPDALANVVGDPRDHAPWALTLATGERCALLREPLETSTGRSATYGCAGSAVLFALPDRARPVWTIERAKTLTSAPARVAIRRAWW